MSNQVEVDDGQQVTILLEGATADVRAGGHGHHGDLVLKDGAGHERIRLGRIAATGSSASKPGTKPGPAPPPMGGGVLGLRLQSPAGQKIAELGQPQPSPTTHVGGAPAPVTLHLGGNGVHGVVVATDEAGSPRARLGGENGPAGAFALPWGTADPAVEAMSEGAGDGVSASALAGSGVTGRSTWWWGVSGRSSQGFGVVGESESAGSFGALGAQLPGDPEIPGSRFPTGVIGEGAEYGVFAHGGRIGVSAEADAELTGNGVSVANGIGLSAKGNATGVLAILDAPAPEGFPSATAGEFWGPVRIAGDLWVLGTKHFVIDHPDDPENAYLVHSAVESDERLNVYAGTVVLDVDGRAVVEVPSWTESLNRDLRYQLTPIGGPAPDLHIAAELEAKQFRIAGGTSGMKVSWQLTGVRDDAHARAHPVPVELGKRDSERGRLLSPEDHGLPEDRAIDRDRRELLRRLDSHKRLVAARAFERHEPDR
jgi:hypothetical protein